MVGNEATALSIDLSPGTSKVDVFQSVFREQPPPSLTHAQPESGPCGVSLVSANAYHFYSIVHDQLNEYKGQQGGSRGEIQNVSCKAFGNH